MPDAPARPRAFFDSNVWLYALVGAAAPAKQARASRLLAATVPVVSTQVVNEVTANLLRKYGWSEPRVRAVIRRFYSDCDVVSHGLDLQLDASRLRERYQFSPYDGLIVAAALRAGVGTLYTEDLQDGLVVRGVLTVVNPFIAPAAPPGPPSTPAPNPPTPPGSP